MVGCIAVVAVPDGNNRCYSATVDVAVAAVAGGSNSH